MRAALALGAAGALVALFPAAGRTSHTVIWFNGNDAPAWSPNGSLIAYTAFRGKQASEIYVMRPNGTARHDVTNHAGYDDLAVWSPDSSRIAFTSNRSGDDEIYVMNADGTGQTQLTHSEGADYAGSWSRDGRKIAFWSQRDGNPEIYVMNADGSEQTRLTSNRASDYSPNWSPDGRIAFVTNRDIAPRTTLFIMNADGTGQRQLTGAATNWNESRPVWSPDGTKLGFVSSHDFPIDNTEIYEMNADGTGETRITHSPLPDDWPTWSPDGRKIAFSHGLFLAPEIYDVNVDGTGARLLSRKGPVLETRFLVFPQPVAGRRFTVILGVRTGTGATVARAQATCSARVGAKIVTVASRKFAKSQARCVWLVPRSASGKLISVTIGARVSTSVLTETERTQVR